MLAESLEEANSSTFITCEPDGVGTLTAVPQTGTGAFVYAFIYKNTYTVYNETFADLGPTTLVQILDTDAPDVLSKTISGIPVLLNGSGDNYDVNNIKVQIYRTVDGGQEFYLIGEVANGVTGFVDNFSDETIQNNEVLYTSGGVPDNDPPPLAKYCHTVNGKTYYAHIKEGSEIFPTLIRQSQNLDCDSVPFNYEDTVEDEINGISSVQDIPIVGCKRHVYRIDGSFDEVGRGGMSHRRISDHAGCVSHDSFVQAEGGLFWFGIDGIYHTEGYKAMKVTDNLNSTYKNAMETLVDKTRKVKGVYNATTRSIYWTFSRTSKTTGFEECDAIWVLDLMWGISEEMTCSVWYGFSTFSPSALMVYNNQLYRADARGYVLKFQENVGTDPQIKTGLPASTWFQETIKYKFTWISHNFGSSNQRKFANRIGLDILSKTNFSIQTKLTNDEGRVVRYTKGIRYRKNFQWGDEDFVWGNPAFSWFYGGITTSDRRMPAKGLRFNYLQFELSNDYTVIRNSDVWGNALIDNATKTATIIVSPNTWPIHAVDYYLYLEQDNFLNAYKIVDRTDTVIILENPTGTFIDGSQRWEIKGYKKAEVVQLAGVSISYADISRSYDTFNQGDDGEIS
jgi:hypothetical protein